MVSSNHSVIPVPGRLRLMGSAARYLVGKALTILATIFVGIFITMLVVNYPSSKLKTGQPRVSPFSLRLDSQINALIQRSLYNGTFPYDPNGGTTEDQIEAFRENMREEAGLNLPLIPRNLLWTVKALTFDWGELDTTYVQVFSSTSSIEDIPDNPVLHDLPNTLLLVGTAYIFVFLIGLPLALYLARNHGSRLDRVVTVLSPISSVPSWVFAVFLVTIFAVQLRLLPVSGMYDTFKPPEIGRTTTELIKHMLMPVSALVLSLLFQLVYAWRTFFIIYSEEDYVELARAKGLSNRILERDYILKPALPFIITSFTTSLIGFWQLTVALEKIFDWPGIGRLYIEALPNYWEESVQIGDLMIIIQIVVIFAYLLGLLVFALDLVYVIVDPRIHLVPSSNLAQKNARTRPRLLHWNLLPDLRGGKKPRSLKQVQGLKEKRKFSSFFHWGSIKASVREAGVRNRLFFQELRRYPSAMFGLAIIFILLAGSLYAVLALPYEEFGREFEENRATGRSFAPRVALPIWLNYFNTTPRLSTLIMGEENAGASVSTRILDNGWIEKIVTFTFDYNYAELPSDTFLYLDPTYTEKFPFVSLTWVTPDGTSLDLKAIAVNANSNYDFEVGIPVAKLLNENPLWREWFVQNGQYPTPKYFLLFAEPNSEEFMLQRGTYQLIVTSLFFEEHNDMHPQLVLLGQVYGLAGTDFWRRDLMIPLFWGMPFALFVGLLGTFITTIIAMILPAIGVWYGGWLDNFLQRLTEVNMVLPGLAIAVLINLLFGVNIWIVLGIVVLLNAFGSPIKSFRAAFLQAKEAPYVEVARSYGASDFRIISRYLVPRILPVFIPQLVTQIPGFIFLEATLGFFNINSSYPSWGRIIYDGLARGALYGSPFWVLEPIFLLLLTGLAFAMLGSALERIFNPRVIADIPLDAKESETEDSRKQKRPKFNRRLVVGLAVAGFAFAIFVPTVQGKSLASVFIYFMDETLRSNRILPKSSPTLIEFSPATIASTLTDLPESPTPASLTPVPIETVSVIPLPSETKFFIDFTPTPPLGSVVISTISVPAIYTLQRGEYPYCIANRFNVDPDELLALSGLARNSTYYAGTVLTIPQIGKPFPGVRMLKSHPTVYIITSPNETIYSIACSFGDVDPLAIAQANVLSSDADLFIGQQLNIP